MGFRQTERLRERERERERESGRARRTVVNIDKHYFCKTKNLINRNEKTTKEPLLERARHNSSAPDFMRERIISKC